MNWVELGSKSTSGNVDSFCEAVNVWIRRPNVCSKIHSCSVITEFDHHQEDSVPVETTAFAKKLATTANFCPKCKSAVRFNFDEVVFKLRKLIPKQTDRFHQSSELILVFPNAFIFIPLNQTMPDVDKTVYLLLYHKCEVQSNTFNILAFYLDISEKPCNKNPSEVEDSNVKASFVTDKWLASVLLPTLQKWTNFQPNKTSNDLPPSLSLIDGEKYSVKYNLLKKKYGLHLAKIWPEVTDPQKYVYEDVAIATYLLVLWEEERIRKKSEERQSFIDLGCGNGLLVYILNSEGHPGKGVDVCRRKIWEMYGSDANLAEDTATPDDINMVRGYDWILGNHSDELTPWIPVMAARSGFTTRYWVLPCCFFDFYGKYERKQSTSGQYNDYLGFVKSVAEICGFKVEVDVLRIPSTKRVCLVGATRTYSPSEHEKILEVVEQFVESAKTTSLSNFTIRAKRQKVQNCTKMDRTLQEKIVSRLVTKLLGTKDFKINHLGKTWNRGGIIPLGKAVSLLDVEMLREMKQECGGLQTLLRNHHQTFEVRQGHVSLRDWSKLDPAPTNHNQATEAFHKTKLCWFYVTHPGGCPRWVRECPFAHGEGDLRKVDPKCDKNLMCQKQCHK